MDFWNALGILVRRWYIVAIGLALTALAAVAVAESIAPAYRASGTVVFYAPGKLELPDTGASTAEAQRSNPFLEFGGSLGVTSEVVARSVVAPSAIAAITGNASDTTFDVQPDINARGPILQLNADAPTGPKAVATLDRGIATLNRTLEQQQGAVGAGKDTFVRMAVLRADRTAAPLSGNRVKATGAVIVLGVALTIACAFGFDALLRARRRSQDDGLRAVVVESQQSNIRSAHEPTRAS